MEEDNMANSDSVEHEAILDNFNATDDESSDIVITQGMTFSSSKEAEKLYKSYAKIKGFGVRVRNSRENAIQLVCTREGINKAKKEASLEGESSNQEPQRLSKSTRIGCGASLHCGYNKSTKSWHITKFQDSHNHDMVTPRSTKYLRSHKKFTTTARDLSEAFHSQGIPVGRVLDVLNAGNDKVEFTKRDCYNHITEVRRKKLDEGDASAVHENCIRQQQENPNFRYSISIDKDGRLTNIFWVDARSRAAYEIFGDVVSFDTTYRTNKYNMPFAPFVGIDNHMHTVLFGCALLQDETEESFTWLFKAWLHAMNEKHPSSFITDQDTAMMNAVAKVFPTAKHRLCLWHITKKFPERFYHIYHDKSKFKTDLNQCIHDSISAEDFERAWESLVNEYDLIENDWLRNLYDMRQLWVPCFNKNVFFGGMHTTSRSESINAYFDVYIKARMSLKELVLKCEEAIDNRYEEFRRAEFDSNHKVPTLTLDMELEEHAANVYTSEIFKLFRKELKGILGCKREKLNEEGTKLIYKVAGTSDPRQDVLVEYDTSTKEASCDCKLFEFKGILCKHILSVFYVHNVTQIPPRYVMNRWKKDVAIPILALSATSRAGSRISMGNSELKELFEELSHMSDLSSEVLKHVKEGIREFIVSTKRKYGDILGAEEHDESREEGGNDFQHVQSSQIQDPNITQSKGRKRVSKGKVGRIRSGLEEAMDAGNKCSICNKGGHNKRRCPKARENI